MRMPRTPLQGSKLENSTIAQLSQLAGFRAYVLAILLTIPLVVVFILNPSVIYISDGWWISSIINTINQKAIENPWFAGEPLTYPYFTLFLVSFLAKLIGTWGAIILSALIINFLAVLAVFQLAKEITKSEYESALGTFMFFTFSSFLSGIVLIFDILTKNTAFPEFLKTVHGPSYYLSMKFLPIEGFALPNIFMMSLEPNLQTVALAIILLGVLRNNNLLTAFSLGILVGCNPILGITAVIIVSLLMLSKFGIEAILPLIGIGIVVLIIDSVYLYGILQSGATGGMLATSPIGVLAFIVFLFAFLPLFYFLKINDLSFFIIALSSMLVLSFTKIGYLYATIPLFMFICINSAKGLARADLLKVLIPFFILSLFPLFLTIGAYSVYKPNINWDAVAYIQNHPEIQGQTVWECYPKNETRWLHVYSTTFGTSKVYIADKQTALAYGMSEEKYNERLRIYEEVCGKVMR